MLPSIIKSFTTQPPFLDMNNIVNVNMGFKRRTGEQFVKVITSDGLIFIKTISYSGIESTHYIKIPSFNNHYERNTLIRELDNKGYIQDDIADYLGISQATVSKVLSI